MDYKQDAYDVKQFIRYKDRNSCNNLISRHQSAVYRVCFNVLNDQGLAEEMAQDVFLKAFDRLNKLEDPAKFRAWILRIAYRAAIDALRRKKLRYADIEETSGIADDIKGMDEQLEDREQTAIIVKTINDLGEPDSSIFTLFYLEEMSTEEIAESLNMTKSNIKVRLMRGREKLKRKLSKIIKYF